MNQQQRKYARDRLQAIQKEAVQRIRNRHTTREKRLSWAERANKVAEGDVPLLDRGVIAERIRRCSSLSPADVFDFSAFENDRVYDQDAATPELAVLESRYNAVSDELMLGDSEAALNLLRDFEAFTQEEN
jgi:hypothetical protein